MQMIEDEQAVTVTIETVLLFSITVMLLGMVMLSFQSINEQASETVMREQYGSIGNDVASKILDLDIEVKASLSQGSVVAIEDELDLKYLVANKPYSLELATGKVIVKSIGSPSVTVEVPFDPTLNVVSGSTIYSTASEHILMYDPNGQIMFKNGGVDATIDDQWPIIHFETPPEAMETLNGTETINVFTWDDIEIAKVEYFIGQNYETATGAPFDWEWNTETISDGYYTITAMAYDRAGHYSYDTRTFKVYNGLDLEPPTAEVISPRGGEVTDFNPPPVEVIVRDNLMINRDSIELKLDDIVITDNATITNTSLLEYNIKYTPSALSIGNHTISIFAKEMYYGINDTLNKNKNVTFDWSFTIKPISDDTDPVISILFPQNYWDQKAGDKIKVTYSASDLYDSGLDHIIINVTNDTHAFIHRENVSYYPDIIETLINSWQFNETYELNMDYSYNVTVFDRAGKSNSTTKNNLPVRRGESEDIIVSTNDTNTKNKTILFTIRSSGPTLGITGMDVSFSSGAELEKLKIGNINKQNLGLSSPANLTWSPSEQITTSVTDVILEFKPDLTSDPVVTIHFQDQTSITVTITRNP